MAEEGAKTMKIRTHVYVFVAVAVFSIALIGNARAANNPVPGWDPNAFRDLSTLQIMTVGPEEGEHWSKLWLVVIDGQVYVRLGDRSFGRIEKITRNPLSVFVVSLYVNIYIGCPVPAEQLSESIGEQYSSA